MLCRVKLIPPVAQWLEHRAYTSGVPGSSPGRRTRSKTRTAARARATAHKLSVTIRQKIHLLDSFDMGLDSFNKDKPSRRDVLRGMGAIAATSLSRMPQKEAPAAEIPAAASQESLPVLETVSEREVRAVLGNLLGTTPFQETRKLADGNGLCLLEVTIPDPDGKGGTVEYSFRRGRAEKSELQGYRVDKTFYDADGMPIGGGSAAQKIEGKWSFTL